MIVTIGGSGLIRCLIRYDHFSEFEAGSCLESWGTDEVPEMGFFATQWADQLPQEKESGQKWTVQKMITFFETVYFSFSPFTIALIP